MRDITEKQWRYSQLNQTKYRPTKHSTLTTTAQPWKILNEKKKETLNFFTNGVNNPSRNPNRKPGDRNCNHSSNPNCKPSNLSRSLDEKSREPIDKNRDQGNKSHNHNNHRSVNHLH